ncbi:hypothetical protein PEBR_30642 [Penicillium brasilianum]|uniref:Aminotransferase class I/classII large domain-containing protein n=1 Tax=Penicillium brasilianum TaxID=104259 RepID=A0A1S9RG84_PENBI|nr:hypothetical protein PEBR_30642 [Penicillium brasilianum]
MGSSTFDLEYGCIEVAALESSVEEKDVVILHANAHNLTGHHPAQEQWKKIAEGVGRKKLFLVFDCAYQGLRIRGYRCRCMGNPILLLYVVYGTPLSIPPEGAKAHLVQAVRAESSGPSVFGARIVQTGLDDTELYLKWQKDARMMAFRIKRVRALISPNWKAWCSGRLESY